MSDTQWPRFEVFVQERPGRPHLHAGSVHAPDPEMALLNARDVFVRRPECASLWVAPSATVRGGTAEELPQLLAAARTEPGTSSIEYLVFAKVEERGTLTHVGEVHAAGILRHALDNIGGALPYLFLPEELMRVLLGLAP